jgi:hypothetical protein
MHTTSCAAERNWSTWGHIYSKTRARLAIERAEKLVFIKQNYKSDLFPQNEADWEVCLRLLDEDDEPAAAKD